MTKVKTRTKRTVIQLQHYLLQLLNQGKQQKQRLQQLYWQALDAHLQARRVYAHATLLFPVSFLFPQPWVMILGTST